MFRTSYISFLVAFNACKTSNCTPHLISDLRQPFGLAVREHLQARSESASANGDLQSRLASRHKGLRLLRALKITLYTPRYFRVRSDFLDDQHWDTCSITHQASNFNIICCLMSFCPGHPDNLRSATMLLPAFPTSCAQT